MKVIVVGAGVIGASVAYQLAKRGAAVTVVDGGAPAATAASFGWINASFYVDEAHHALRCEGIAAYGRLCAALPDLPITLSGALWWEAQGDALAAMQGDLERLGYPVERVGQAAARTLEPDVANLPNEVLRFPSEGCAEPTKLAAVLLAASGARVLRGCRVEAVLQVDCAVRGVRTATGEIACDHVVIAAGAGVPDLLAPLGVSLPMLRRPGVIVQTVPVAARLSHVLVTPEGEVRQLPNGRLISPAAANHQADSAEEITAPLDEIAARTAARLARLVGLDHLDWAEVSVGYRPVPLDGLPVIGPAGPAGLHVAVMHSGVTLGAIAGEAIAAMVMKKASNAQMAMLAPYRADRFSAG